MMEDILETNEIGNNVNELETKMNVRFVIFCDAAFFISDGKSAYGVTIYFDSSLIVADAVKGKRCFNAKEAEVGAILYPVRRAIDFLFHKIHIACDAQEIIDAINGTKTELLIFFC